MNGPPRSHGPYRSPRPTPQGSSTIRVSGKSNRACAYLCDCDPIELQHFILAVMQLGYCTSFTGTSDGGAVSITVFDGATRYKDYARSPDELLRCYRDLLAAIRGEE